MRTVSRVYACLYALLISLTALGLAWLGFSGAHLRLPMFYAEGVRLTWWLLATGIVGLATVLLAMIDAARWPLSLLVAVVFAVLFRGYFLSSYVFSGASGFWSAVVFTAGALIAFACTVVPQQERRRLRNAAT